MKQLVCEMCGGKDLIKQDSVFVCQNCGSKYSVEEAKKMMVTIDTSAKKENALKNARRAMENKDYEKAEECYNIVQMEDPDNWEANFYSIYLKAKLLWGAESIENCIKSVLRDIKKLDDNAQRNEAIKQMSTEICAFALKSAFLSASNSFRAEMDGIKDYASPLLSNMLTSFGNELISEFGKNEFTTSIKIQCDETILKVKIEYYESLLQTENDVITTFIKENKCEYIQWDKAEKYADELAKINPTSYELTRFNENKRSEKKKWIPCGIIVLIIFFCLIGMILGY